MFAKLEQVLLSPLSQFNQLIYLNFAHPGLHLYNFTFSNDQMKQKENGNRLVTLDFRCKSRGDTKLNGKKEWWRDGGERVCLFKPEDPPSILPSSSFFLWDLCACRFNFFCFFFFKEGSFYFLPDVLQLTLFQPSLHLLVHHLPVSPGLLSHSFLFFMVKTLLSSF